MQSYSYRAMNVHGKIMRGSLGASSVEDLSGRLSSMGLELISFKEVKLTSSLMKKKVKRRELIDFCFYFEQLIRAGVPILEALEDVASSMENPSFQEVILSVINSVRTGKGLSEALAEFPDIFDSVFINLIKVGEMSGELNAVLANVIDTLKWQDELASQTKKALMYPIVTGVVVTGVTFFLMIYLVPQMVSFIKSMGHELPFHTIALIALSDFLVAYWYIVLAVPIIGYFVISFLYKNNDQVHYLLDKIKLQIWLFGTIHKKIVLSRFTNYFALLYSSGVTVLDALEITQKIVGNVVVAESIGFAHQRIANGESMGDSFASAQMFPPIVVRMIRVGESTGGLDDALRNVSYFYNRDVKEAVEKLQTMIEPAMTLILGAIIGWVMLSVLGPIYDLISKLKT